jgi:hypothetical protein
MNGDFTGTRVGTKCQFLAQVTNPQVLVIALENRWRNKTRGRAQLVRLADIPTRREFGSLTGLSLLELLTSRQGS